MVIKRRVTGKFAVALAAGVFRVPVCEWITVIIKCSVVCKTAVALWAVIRHFVQFFCIFVFLFSCASRKLVERRRRAAMMRRTSKGIILIIYSSGQLNVTWPNIRYWFACINTLCSLYRYCSAATKQAMHGSLRKCWALLLFAKNSAMCCGQQRLSGHRIFVLADNYRQVY